MAVEGGSHVGSHLQVHGRDAWNIGDELPCEGLEAVAHRACRRRELEGEADAARFVDREVLDHAEADDIATEVWVLDRGKDGQDLLPTGH